MKRVTRPCLKCGRQTKALWIDTRGDQPLAVLVRFVHGTGPKASTCDLMLPTAIAWVLASSGEIYEVPLSPNGVH